MNPDKTIRVGDRVRIKTTSSGYGRTHIGRTAKVIRIDQRDLYGSPLGSSRYRFGQLAPWELTNRYLVELEGVRKEQVYATTVEKIHEVVPAVGDRVIVRKINNFPNGDSSAEGKPGVITEILPGYFKVRLDEEPGLSPWIATEVQVIETVTAYEAATAAVGDRVTVIRGDAVGRVGTVQSISEPYKIGGDIKARIYRVKFSDGRISAATKVARIAAEDLLMPVKVGDRVKFIEGWVSGTSSPSAGRIGTVADVEIRDGRFRYTVDFGFGDRKLARKVEPAPAPAEPLADWERELLSTGTLSVNRPEPKTAEPEIPVELPMKNMQAASFAHQLLGNDADLDKLIGMAEFVMDRRTVESPGLTGTVPVPPERFITGIAADGPSPSATVTPAVLPSTEDLVITDRDGDAFTVSHLGIGSTLAKVYVRNQREGSQFAAYLTEADVDAVIARLQAFKAQGMDSMPF